MRSTTIVLAATVAAGTFLHAQTIDSATFGAMEARALGPAVTRGRVTSIDASDPKVLYVGAAKGGVWKNRQARHLVQARFRQGERLG